MRVHLLLLAFLLLLRLKAQNKCEFVLTSSVYEIDHTLVIGPDLSLDEIALNIRFHKVDHTTLVIQATILSQKIEFFYFPRASFICIAAENRGSILYDVLYGAFIKFELDDSNVKIAGIPYQYNPAHPDCQGATHLGVGSFGNKLA